jgi:hypothetical protein
MLSSGSLMLWLRLLRSQADLVCLALALRAMTRFLTASPLTVCALPCLIKSEFRICVVVLLTHLTLTRAQQSSQSQSSGRLSLAA